MTRPTLALCGFAMALGACSAARSAAPTDEGGVPAGAPEEVLLVDVGFAERERWPSTVLHLDRAEVRGSGRLSGLLRRSDQVRFDRPQGNGWGLSTVESHCPISVFVNGTMYARLPRAGSAFDLDGLIAPRDIDGLEVHIGPDGPVRREGACGAVLIWTRAIPIEAPFRGTVRASVGGADADTVTSVVLYPGGIRLEGRSPYFEASVLPGEYEVAFMAGAIELSRRPLRVFAHHEFLSTLDVNGPRIVSAPRRTRGRIPGSPQ